MIIGKLTEISGVLSKINPYIKLVDKLTHLFGHEILVGVWVNDVYSKYQHGLHLHGP